MPQPEALKPLFVLGQSLPTAPFMNSIFKVSGILTLIGVFGIVGSQPRRVRRLRILFVLVRRSQPWHEFGNWLAVAGPLALVLAVLFFASLTPAMRHATVGLPERILVVEIATWYVALGWCVALGSWAFAGGVRRALPPLPSHDRGCQ